MAALRRRRNRSPASPPAADGVTVTFTRHHRHAGRDYSPGDTASVPADTAELLHRFGVIQPPDGDPVS